jgi:hypothetical protein
VLFHDVLDGFAAAGTSNNMLHLSFVKSCCEGEATHWSLKDRLVLVQRAGRLRSSR